MAVALKRGDLVRALRDRLEDSLEIKASDTRLPPYLFETRGEIVEIRQDYALVKFGYVPTPNIWLRLDQLEKF
ncbi:MAG: NAD(P)H-quinone oxidoreductase subunit O [Cyanobacteria bacterium REEB459]|nr:NAD(P)H-quinone oxidoreductase subunit O [Cyanobacteria bacterium REEB459]